MWMTVDTSSQNISRLDTDMNTNKLFIIQNDG